MIQNKYTLDVFLGLWKAFDTVDRNIFIDKLNLYEIKNSSLKKFPSYLSIVKKFIHTGARKTFSLDIICRVTQGTTLAILDQQLKSLDCETYFKKSINLSLWFNNFCHWKKKYGFSRFSQVSLPIIPL